MDDLELLRELIDRGVMPAFETGEKYITIPGIRDIIQLTPRERLTDQILEAHRICTWKNPPTPTYAANMKFYEERMEAGERIPSPLNPSQLESMIRRREVANNIRNSPSPELARSIGSVLTWFDDMGDRMTAAAWSGKGALWLLEKIGVKVASRAIPYLGWCLLAKDIFDVVNIFKLIGAIGKWFKKEKLKDSSLNPFSAQNGMKRIRKIAQRVPGFGDIIEMAQVSSDLFGVGLSFGPIVGFAQDLFFGAIGGTTKFKAGFETAPSPIDSIIKGFDAGAFINGFGQEFSVEEHMLGLTCFAAAVDMDGRFIRDVIDYALDHNPWDIPRPPRVRMSALSRHALLELEIDPDQSWPWHLPGNPKEVTLKEICNHLAHQSPKCVQHWLPAISGETKGLVAQHLIKESMRVLDLVCGEDVLDDYTLLPAAAVEKNIIEGKTEYPWGAGEEVEVAFIEELIKNEEEKQGRKQYVPLEYLKMKGVVSNESKLSG